LQGFTEGRNNAMQDMRLTFGQTLLELGKRNDRIVLLDADLCTSTCTHLFKAALPNQFIQMGIAEQNTFGWAAGLATQGFIPFPSTFAAFACSRALDQVKVSIAYPCLNVKIPGSYAGLSTNGNGATHQTVEDIAIMRCMPNMRVLSPCDNEELMQMMEAMIAYEGPVYFRIVRFGVDKLTPQGYRFDWKPVLLREGSDLLLVSTGCMTSRCVKAADALSGQGIRTAVLHVPCIKPFVGELLLKYAEKCRAVVTAEDHSVYGGLGSMISEYLSETLPVIVERIGYPDVFIRSGRDEDIFRGYGLREEDILRAAQNVLKKKK
jgi:transketolase